MENKNKQVVKNNTESVCEICNNKDIEFFQYLYDGKLLNICINCKLKEDKRIKKILMKPANKIRFEKRQQRLNRWEDF